MRRKSVPREYIPVYRSGAYALIIALHEAEQKPSWCGYLKKDELMAEAQPFSDSSFTVSEAGSYYTAWSSMTKLVERGLIIRYSHPPKFKLSEKGVSMAVRLLQGGSIGPDLSQSQTSVSSQTSGQSTPPVRKSQKKSNEKPKKTREKLSEKPRESFTEKARGRSKNTSEERAGESSCEKLVPSPPSSLGTFDRSPSPSVLSTSSHEFEDHPLFLPHSQSTQSLTQHGRRLEFWYVSPEGQQVHYKDQAAVTFNEELSVGFLVKCRRRDLEESIFQYTIDNLRPSEGEFIFAYLSNEQGPDHSNPPLTTHDHTPNPRLPSSDHVSKTPITNQIPQSVAMTPCSSKRTSPPAPVLITLSDSDPDDNTDMTEDANCSRMSDDVEILKPLSERVGFKHKLLEPSSGSTSRKKTSTGSNSTPQVREKADSVCTPLRGGSVGEEKSLTPAQKAGMAAVERMRGRQSSRDQTASTKISTSGGCTLSSHRDTRRVGVRSRDLTSPKSTISKSQSPQDAMVVDLTFSAHPPANHSHKENITHPSDKGKSAMPTTYKQPRVTHPSLSEGQTLNITQNQGGQSSSVARQPTRTSCSSAEGSLEGVELGSPEFVLRPGEFDVVLCVDSAESTASRKHTSQFRGLLLQELGKNGVQFDVRKLNVGDFLWVGREKVCPVPGQLSLPRSREVVLEYIVERKRMDDLAGSITDGRFKEQKFRLRNCGVSRPVYLVEEYVDMTHLKLPLRSLNQAIANTQVVNGFFVKRTKDIRESIAYLTVMTRQLQIYYSNKTLKAFPHETITELVRAKHHQSCGGVVYSMPFSSFNDASIKNKVLSVYEMFGRQLIQLPSSSADKAVAILQHYPTVAHLRQAYRECSNTGERVKLLSDIRAGKSRRRLGDSLSSLIYSLYWLGKDT